MPTSMPEPHPANGVTRDFWKSWNASFLEAATSPWYRTLVAIQDQIMRSTVAFHAARGLRTLHLPLTTGSISSPMGLGSDSKPVPIRYAGQDTYLADSMQFMLEYGCRIHEPGVYYVMPSFRGEDPDARHLSQFFHSEAEIPGGLEDVQVLVEDYVRRLAGDLANELAGQIAAAGGDVARLERLAGGAAVEQVTVAEAAQLLRSRFRGEDTVRRHREGFLDITPLGEARLLETVGEFIWLARSDARAVPFYQALSPDGVTTLNADLLLGMGEVVGCGERHGTGEAVEAALATHQVDPADYEWYVRMKHELPLRTAGFGLGLERFVAWVLGADDIRQLQLVPRDLSQNLVP